jgi:hypothetical protein
VRVEETGDELALRLPGVLTLRAEFVAEGYYADDADGEPPEQDLYRVEVTALGPGAGGTPLGYPLLLPAVPAPAADAWESHDPLRWIRGYLLALAPLLAASPPAAWATICEASRAWAPGGDRVTG